MNYNYITIDDQLYPAHLKNIENPPKKLYYIGDLSLIKTPCIAMVGTRRASPYGKWAAYEIAKKIAECGIPVVSGMASGIDTQSHLGCLSKGMGTIAVVGTGVDVVYPKSNQKLYEEICRNGLVLSEYEPGEQGQPWHFPARNRIISGLSDKVVVVEGAYVSGSMITAKLALEQGRDVFAVPGNINQPGSVGVNSLIADGAYPITDLESVNEILGIECSQIELIQTRANPEELLILNIVRSSPGISGAEVSDRINKPISNIISLLCSMELKGMIRSEGSRYYVYSAK